MGTVAADSVGGHEDAEDDAEGADDEEGDGEGDLLDGGSAVESVRGVHHHVLVRDREGMVHVRHFPAESNETLCRSGLGWFVLNKKFVDFEGTKKGDSANSFVSRGRKDQG